MKLTIIQILLSIVASKIFHLEQMNVKATFLLRDLNEKIYTQRLAGFVISGNEHMVCKLNRSLYGLKQALRHWYKKFGSFMCKSDFHESEKDQCCCFKKYTDSYMFLLLYVDDILILGSSMREINHLQASMSLVFAMKIWSVAK